MSGLPGEADAALVDQFLDALWMERGLSANTLAAYRSDLLALAGWLAGQGLDLVSAGRAQLLEYLASREGARVRTTRCRMLAKDGSYRNLQLRGRPALDEHGGIIGHIITLQDTTERDDALRALAVLSGGNRVLSRVDNETQLLREMCQRTDRPVVASGGVSSLDDLIALRELVPLGVEGAIIGKALYDGAFTLPAALDIAGRPANVA